MERHLFADTVKTRIIENDLGGPEFPPLDFGEKTKNIFSFSLFVGREKGRKALIKKGSVNTQAV